MSIKCRHCDAENAEGNSFCGNCGAALQPGGESGPKKKLLIAAALVAALGIGYWGYDSYQTKKA